MLHRRLLIVSMAVVLCLSAFGPAVAAGPATQDESTPDESASNGVTVTTGAQLSTVVTATSEEVRADFENTAFDERMERTNDSDRATAIADRATTLENRSETLRAEYERVTAAYEAGDIDESTYAQRLAALNARAQGVVSSYERLEERVESLDEVDRRAAGVTTSELADDRAAVSELTSAGTDALLRQFTGEARGNAEIEIDGGVSIEVETDDGERSREYDRPRDGNGSLAISQTDALTAATDALSAVDGNSSWSLVEAETDDEGVYEFEFVLTGTETGEAEVSVDGETGTVFELEEEIATGAADGDDDGADEAEDDGADEADGDDRDERVVILVASGSPGPGEQVTLRVLANGQPATDVTVTVNDRAVGETDGDGELTVTLPREDVEIDAERGDAEGELEFEFGDDSDDDDADAESQFDAEATIEDGTVTVSATFDESPVAGATVIANDESVGTTGDDGTISFALPENADELDIEVIRGELETELEFETDHEEADEDEESGDDVDDDDDEETDDDGTEHEDEETDDDER